MSQGDTRRKKTAQALAIAACLACAGFAVHDMLRQVRKRS
jgi:hypothetical protein